MTKQKREIKAASDRNVTRVEHTESFDDNLLPDACEIEKLKALDPTIMDWLKERAAKEQDFRHSALSEKGRLIDNHNRRDHNTTRMALGIYFFLVAGCMGFSYLLVSAGKNLSGSLFGGTAVILGLAVLVSRKRSNQVPSK